MGEMKFHPTEMDDWGSRKKVHENTVADLTKGVQI